MNTNAIRRRTFLQGAAAAACGLIAPSQLYAATGRSGLPWTFCTFTKSLQHLTYEQLAERIAPIGVDGVEVPVRPKGHIEPAAVPDELPKLVEALKAKGLELTILTSGINEVSNEQHTESVLKTAAALGVKRFRMAYYRYDLNKPIRPQVDEFRPRLRDLVALAKQIGIKPIYQNHSGKNVFGAPMWDLHMVLQDMNPADVGVAFDICHATIEGSKAWPLNWSLIRPWVDTVYIKEPRWGEDQRPVTAPLGTGGVDNAFYKTLKHSGVKGPISLHVEYFDHRDPALEGPFLEAVKTDFTTLKKYLTKA
jgi:sugar phosphate isomerase/epimerase